MKKEITVSLVCCAGRWEAMLVQSFKHKGVAASSAGNRISTVKRSLVDRSAGHSVGDPLGDLFKVMECVQEQAVAKRRKLASATENKGNGHGAVKIKWCRETSGQRTL